MPWNHLFSIPLTDPVMIFLCLVAAIFLVPFICRSLGFPEIVGLIAAGILLGPQVLGILARDQIIELFGVVGLLLLMFIAGIEIDVNDFKRYKNRSFLFGLLTFSLPMLLGSTAGLFILRMELLAALLLASMFASHTLLSYPLVGKLRISSDESVGVSVGGTIITDIAALMVLAVVIAAYSGELGPGMALRMGLSLSALVLFCLGILPGISAFIFDKLEKSGDLQFLFTLLVLFLCAALAELAGVEPIIGAFLAGIAVGRYIPPISPLANRIEFFGNAIFIPTFLISVGMLVDPRAFVSDTESLLVSAVMLVCVIVSKWLAAFIMQKKCGWSPAQRNVVFGLSVSQAAATLAAVLVGYRVGILNDAVLNGTIIMILVTVIISAVAVQKGGSEVARQQESGQRSETAEKRILLGIANYETAERLLDLALMLRNDEEKIPLRAVSVLPMNRIDADTPANIEKRTQHLAEKAAAVSARLDIVPRVDQSPGRGLANAAREFEATELVIGWREPKSFFDRNTRDIQDSLELSSSERIWVARLRSPLATFTSMNILLPPNAEKAVDFDACIAGIKNIARHIQGSISCAGEQAGLKAARELFNTEPPLSGIEYREDIQLKSPKDPRRSLQIIVVPRRNNAGWSSEGERIIADMDTKFRDKDILLVRPQGTITEVQQSKIFNPAGLIKKLFRSRQEPADSDSGS